MAVHSTRKHRASAMQGRLRRASQRGFTLVEMLVVAALIAIFSGLAVFNITEQLQQNKSKAAVGEARNIATAMYFAQSDLGFFPKLNFLRFNTIELLDRTASLGEDALEYHSHNVGSLSTKIQKQWRNQYLTSQNVNSLVRMRFTSSNGVTAVADWPADPFRTPYVAYFIHTVPSVQAGQPSTSRFLASAGEAADSVAAIVSYGRNKVPGLGFNPAGTTLNNRDAARLFTGSRDGLDFTLLPAADFAVPASAATQVRLDMMVKRDGTDPDGPRIRERGTDDLYYEF